MEEHGLSIDLESRSFGMFFCAAVVSLCEIETGMMSTSSRGAALRASPVLKREPGSEDVRGPTPGGGIAIDSAGRSIGQQGC